MTHFYPYTRSAFTLLIQHLLSLKKLRIQQRCGVNYDAKHGLNFTNHKCLQRYNCIVWPRSSGSSKWGRAWILTACFTHCTLPSASVAPHFYLLSFKHSFLLSAWRSLKCSFDSVCLWGRISITSVSLGDLWLRGLHFHIWRRRSALQTKKPRLAKLEADRSEMSDERLNEGHAMKVWVPNQSGAPRTIRENRDEAWLYSSHQGKTENRYHCELLSNDAHYDTAFRAATLMRPAAAQDNQSSRGTQRVSNQQRESRMKLEEKVLTTDSTHFYIILSELRFFKFSI